MTIQPIESDAAFREVLKKNKAVLIDFFAVWCAPCKALAPLIEKYSNDVKYANIYFAQIDVEKLPDLSDELNIHAMPTLLLFKDGERASESVDPNAEALIQLIEKGL
ncbi:hypothetical protein NLG97_g4197 [Lecanicillium saksenae]|uniref:Uncharacterized protein n=1 Tax=Lecanicillium saksenae TaxID=468837 RepID=A0ACC1QXB4_9HYPO|nr:hypothetical protein NLG97_g4197 [Lecanicillium saksenae]